MRVKKTELPNFVRAAPLRWRLITACLLPLLPFIATAMVVWEFRYELKVAFQYAYAVAFKRWEG